MPYKYKNSQIDVRMAAILIQNGRQRVYFYVEEAYFGYFSAMLTDFTHFGIRIVLLNCEKVFFMYNIFASFLRIL